MNERTMTIVGWVLTGLYALFMLGASVAPKLLGLPVVEETMAQLGWPAGYGLMIGLILGCAAVAAVLLWLYGNVPQSG